ncbi:NIPSNAP family protein [Acuticoccus sp. M5D2P5]|uniref:NIPSNAP family protein n=1 Tax=Acuticoccus kalidii TaxID=2910977 RepID=UPI001F394A35|nr:NIPSNAP family protein [Acuticoccus kalidii]MCF3936258.1 NIPSNAP family protein [Acuticoccus kalidii]
MLFDHRTYTCRPGTIKKHLALYEEHGFAVQKKHLGEPFLYAATETGDVNTYVHVWAYENAGDRETRRAALQADPDWQAYLKKSGDAGYLVSQVNKLMMPVPFVSHKKA